MQTKPEDILVLKVMFSDKAVAHYATAYTGNDFAPLSWKKIFPPSKGKVDWGCWHFHADATLDLPGVIYAEWVQP